MNKDPVIKNEVILKIANRYVKAAEVTGIEESGGEARGYYIDSNKIIKVQRPHRVRIRTSLEREVFFLNELSSFPEILVPHVYGYGREDDQIEYILMSRIPGKAMNLINPKSRKRDKILFELGKMLYYLHNLPDQEKLLKSNFFPIDNTTDDLSIRLINPLKIWAAKIEQEDIEWTLDPTPEEIINNVSKKIQYDVKRAVHSNPALTHTFVDSKKHAFTGVIDLGDAYISHPANDLRRFLNPLDRKELFKGYNAVRKVNESFMSVYIVTQLLSDFRCIAEENEFKDEALKEVEEISCNYIL